MLELKLAVYGNRVMLEAKTSGRIVNLASIAGKMASTVLHPAYNVSKPAVLAMTKTFAAAYAAAGIRVNAVCPGIIQTEMQDAVDAQMAALQQRAPEAIRDGVVQTAKGTSRIDRGVSKVGFRHLALLFEAAHSVTQQVFRI